MVSVRDVDSVRGCAVDFEDPGTSVQTLIVSINKDEIQESRLCKKLNVSSIFLPGIGFRSRLKSSTFRRSWDFPRLIGENQGLE